MIWIFCLFACWCNSDISVPYSLLLLIEQLYNQIVFQNLFDKDFVVEQLVIVLRCNVRVWKSTFDFSILQRCWTEVLKDGIFLSYYSVIGKMRPIIMSISSRLYWSTSISNGFFFAASLLFQVILLRFQSQNNRPYKLTSRRSTWLIFWYWWYQLGCLLWRQQ